MFFKSLNEWQWGLPRGPLLLFLIAMYLVSVYSLTDDKSCEETQGWSSCWLCVLGKCNLHVSGGIRREVENSFKILGKLSFSQVFSWQWWLLDHANGRLSLVRVLVQSVPPPWLQLFPELVNRIRAWDVCQRRAHRGNLALPYTLVAQFM